MLSIQSRRSVAKLTTSARHQSTSNTPGRQDRTTERRKGNQCPGNMHTCMLQPVASRMPRGLMYLKSTKLTLRSSSAGPPGPASPAARWTGRSPARTQTCDRSRSASPSSCSSQARAARRPAPSPLRPPNALSHLPVHEHSENDSNITPRRMVQRYCKANVCSTDLYRPFSKKKHEIENDTPELSLQCRKPDTRSSTDAHTHP